MAGLERKTRSSVVVVSGLLSNVECWLEFEKEWRSILTKYGIDVFHRSELAAKKGKFKGWTEEKEIALLGELTTIIGRLAPFMISHGVRLGDFEEVKSELEDIKVSPYIYCCEQSITGINFLNNLIPFKEPIQICFDQGRKYGSETMQVFIEATSRAKSLSRYSIGGISFARKDVVVPLQAADFVAYEMYRHFVEHIEDPENITRPTLRNLVAATEHHILMSRTEHIRNWFNMYLENRRMN